MIRKKLEIIRFTSIINKMFKRTLPSKVKIFGFFGGILFFAISIQLINSIPFFSGKSLVAYANDVVAACSKKTYHPSCYDKEIPKLMSSISMEDAFKVTWLVQERDPSYQYCHVLGHELSAREVAKNAAKWMEIVARCPSGICSNGCIHGGFQEKFRTESFTDQAQIDQVKPDLMVVCEERASWHPTGLEQASCYHALGHLTMYITAADLNKALNLCDEIANKGDGRNLIQLCYDGAFMQIFQPLEPEDFALVEGKQPDKTTLLSFCNKFKGMQRGSCISESWPLFSDEIKTPEGFVKFCGMEEASEKSRCYNGIFYVVTAQMNFDSSKISSYCSQMPAYLAPTCFSNGSSRMIETDYRNIDKSVNLCRVGEQYDPKGQCFEELLKYSTFNFHKGSPEFFKLCNSLPEKWKNECLK